MILDKYKYKKIIKNKISLKKILYKTKQVI